jgi:hypothetical protein
MPVAHNPHLPEFYVYAFVVKGYPFYVGLGRSGRASMRIKYVLNLICRECHGKPVKWVPSTWVMAQLLKNAIIPELKFVETGLVREEAISREKQIIKRYRNKGWLLTNRIYNGGNAVTKEKVLEAVLKHLRHSTRSLLRGYSRRKQATPRDQGKGK